MLLKSCTLFFYPKGVPIVSENRVISEYSTDQKEKYVCPCRLIVPSFSATSRLSVLFAQYRASCLTLVEIPLFIFYIPVTFPSFRSNFRHSDRWQHSSIEKNSNIT